jgi:hypothetical protein
MGNDDEQADNPQQAAWHSLLDRLGGFHHFDSRPAPTPFVPKVHNLPNLTPQQWRAMRVRAKAKRAAKEAARMAEAAHAQD